MQRPSLPFLALSVLAGCSGLSNSPCGQDPFGDLCAYETFKEDNPPDSKVAAEQIARMKDPTVRTTAVQFWMQGHPKATPGQAGVLCDLLLEGEKQNCARRANSPHLHR